MFVAEIKVEREKAPQGSVYRGQGAVTVALAVLSVAALLWAAAVSIEQARSPSLHAGLEEGKAAASRE